MSWGLAFLGKGYQDSDRSNGCTTADGPGYTSDKPRFKITSV